MKRKSPGLIFALAFVSCSNLLSAQMPNFYGSPTPSPAPPSTSIPSSSASGQTLPPNAKTPEATTGASTSGGTGTGTGGGVSPTPAPTPTPPAGQVVPTYNPAMDNHVKAPVANSGTGLFGLPVKQVEDALRFQGAKNHSYAFGKYSRMVFSAYLITIFFDRERKVGGFSIEPREPFKTVEPGARDYFMQTFLKGADLSKFAITMASDRLEVQYAP